MYVGLLSKITRNGCLKSSPSLKYNSSPFHLCSSSQHATLSRSHLWKVCSRNGSIQSPGSILARTPFSKNVPVTISNRRLSHSLTSPNNGIGRRSIFTRFATDGVLIGLIMANVTVFILWKVADTQFMRQNFMISYDNFISGRWHTFITYAFSQLERDHLISNMILLYFFGKSIGDNFGPQYLLKLYFGGSVVGSIIHVLYHCTMNFLSDQSDGRMHHTVNFSRMKAFRTHGASGAVGAMRILLVMIFVYRDNLRMCMGDLSASVHLGGEMVAAFACLRTWKGRFGRF